MFFGSRSYASEHNYLGYENAIYGWANAQWKGKAGYLNADLNFHSGFFFFGAHWGNLDELFYYIEKKGVHLSPVNH